MAGGTSKGMANQIGFYAADKLGYRKASILHTDFVYSEDLMTDFAKCFEQRGGTVIQRQRTPFATVDFAPYIASIDREADFLALWILEDEAVRFYKQAQDYGLDMPIVFTWIGPLWEGAMPEVGELTVGTIGQAYYNPTELTGRSKEFTEQLKAKYNVTPGFYEEAYYDTVMLYLEAVRATGGDTTYEKIIEALRKVQVEAPSSRVSFDEDGIGIRDAYIVKIVERNGAHVFETIDKYEQVAWRGPSE